MNKRKTTDKIIIHCSATPAYMDVGADRIRKWHKARGFDDIGYHFVVTRDGWIEEGRRVDYVGAHCKGQNSRSVGICMVGGVNGAGKPENNFTIGQFKACQELIVSICSWYDIKELAGHNEYSSKACPSFEVSEFLKLPENG